MAETASNNGFTFVNAAAGSPATVEVQATGSSTNVNLKLTPKGTGAVLLPDGASGTPALAFSSETNTGLYRVTSGQIGITTGGTLRSIWSTGNQQQRSDLNLTWGSSGFTSPDIGLSRAGTNTLKVNNASTGGGALMVGGSTGQPTCSSTIRGALWVVNSSTGVGDIVQACLKGTADTYTWVTITAAP